MTRTHKNSFERMLSPPSKRQRIPSGPLSTVPQRIEYFSTLLGRNTGHASNCPEVTASTSLDFNKSELGMLREKLDCLERERLQAAPHCRYHERRFSR